METSWYTCVSGFVGKFSFSRHVGYDMVLNKFYVKGRSKEQVFASYLTICLCYCFKGFIICSQWYPVV